MIDGDKDPVTDWEGFYKEFRDETERGRVILATAFLDAQLEELIRLHLVEHKKFAERLLDFRNGKLRNFHDRIEAAFNLGAIDEVEQHDLFEISRIRNPFAHRIHGYSFELAEVKKHCDALILPKWQMDNYPEFSGANSEMLFVMGIRRLVERLGLRIINKHIELEPTTHKPRSERSIRGRKQEHGQYL